LSALQSIPLLTIFMIFHGRPYALCDELIFVLRMLFRTIELHGFFIALVFRMVANRLKYTKAAALFSTLPC
jgi:hypothetical protein